MPEAAAQQAARVAAGHVTADDVATGAQAGSAVALRDGAQSAAWRPDHAYNACMQCSEVFTMTSRRHHCRLCGWCLCKRCSSAEAALPGAGIARSRHRACVACAQSPPERMNAVLYTEYGGEAVLTEALRPKPAAGEVLVRVHAAALNPIDYKTRRGDVKLLMTTPFPAVIGLDVSGVVEAVGQGAQAFKPGDEVIGRVSFGGTMAEYAICPEGLLTRKPGNLSHEQAAAIPLAAVTAEQALQRAGAGAGKRVFITAGAGGVGTFAIQLAKRVHGVAHVGTTARPGAKTELCTSLGADTVVDYHRRRYSRGSTPDWWAGIPREYDAAIDCSGESTVLAEHLVKPGGTVVSIVEGFHSECLVAAGHPAPGAAIRVGMWHMYREVWNRCAAANVTFHPLWLRLGTPDLAKVAAAAERGEMRPVIDQVFQGLGSAPQALAKLEQGHAAGKVVVRLPQSAATRLMEEGHKAVAHGVEKVMDQALKQGAKAALGHLMGGK